MHVGTCIYALAMAHDVLVVEDEEDIAVPLMRTLEREGYEVNRVSVGAEAVSFAVGEGPAVVILDLGLPDMDGIDVCRQMRSGGYLGGIIMVTARAGELDRVVGLDVGADDYLAKPFGLAELLARVRALLRRSGSTPAPDDTTVTTSSGLKIDAASRRVHLGDREIALTAKEFDVLAVLATNHDKVVPRETLMNEVWDQNWYGSTKTLDVTMPGLDGLAVTRRLRAKGLRVPILLLTARDAVHERVAGLDAGADDYLAKPFDTAELTARVRALLRRSEPPGEPALAFADLALDPATGTVQRAGRTIELTRREAGLLELLLRNARGVVTRELALEEVWGGEDVATPNAVDRYIAYLRRKLGEPPLIHTVRGVGFKLDR